MIKYLTVDSVLDLHSVVKEHFHDHTTSGKIDEYKIQSILDKPGRKFGNKEMYPTIYEKAACILESFCREHIFTDGNKRTAVLAMFVFLTINNHNIVLPLSITKYAAGITKCMDQKPEDIEALIKDISKWIEKRSSTNSKNHKKKLIRYLYLPWLGMVLLLFSIIGAPIQYVIIQDWFQTKMHPEYESKIKLQFDFILVVPFKLKQHLKQQA